MKFLGRSIWMMMLMVLCTASFAQADFEEFKEGYYITNKDEKVQGWIRYVKGVRPKVEYKKSRDGKTRYVTAFGCKEFVMGPDIRFVRVPKSVIVKVAGLNRTVTYDFFRVIEEGKINLYKHYTETESKTKHDFTPINVEIALIRKGDSRLVPLSGDDKKTQESLEALFPGEPKAVKTLMTGNWEEILKFVRDYNKS